MSKTNIKIKVSRKLSNFLNSTNDPVIEKIKRHSEKAKNTSKILEFNSNLKVRKKGLFLMKQNKKED